MNPAALAMMPTTANNVTKQPSTTGTSSIGKFGEALNNAMVNKSEVTETSPTQAEVTTEEAKAIQDLLAFLGVESLSELNDGNELLQSLIDSKSVKAELENIISGTEGNDMDTIDSLLSSLLAELQPEEGQNQVDVPSEIYALFQKLDCVDVNVKDGSKLELHVIDKDNQDQVDVPSEIYALLQTLDRVDVKDWLKLDLNNASNLLKLAKLQDLLAFEQDLSQDAALMQKEIKHLLASISGKLEKWLGSQPKTGNDSAFSAALLENGVNKPLEVMKQAYSRVLGSEDEMTKETVSNGITLRTSETNTQSSGLPFQMSKLEQYVLTASKNGQALDSEQFIKSFENILSKANFTKANGVQKLLIRLNPENLGSLRIELVQKDGAMIAKILATTAQAKELLDRQVQGLKHAFINQNIAVEKIEISQQISTFNAERFAPRDQGQQEQRQQQTEKEIIDEEETDFTDRFEELLLNLKV